MITEAHQKESLGIAYIGAIAAKVGLNLTISRIHDYGVDGTFHPVQRIGKRIAESGHPLDFQLKSTINWEIDNDLLIYDLEVIAYNDLIRRTEDPHAIPFILIVFCMPDNSDIWLTCKDDELILRHCCYYHQVTGTLSTNTQSVRIKIPITQRLCPDELYNLIEFVKQGGRVIC